MDLSFSGCSSLFLVDSGHAAGPEGQKQGQKSQPPAGEISGETCSRHGYRTSRPSCDGPSGTAPITYFAGLIGLLCCVIVPLQRGAIYARFSTKYQHSIDDQVRKCQEWAEQQGITVKPEHIFVDEGVTGRSSRRTGLHGLRQVLDRGEVDVLIALATNRLFRKAYKAAQFVEEEIVDRGKRAVFIDTNIDTADEGRWRHYFQMHAMMDEFTATSTVGHIRASQEGLFLQKRVFGTLTYGYMGEEIPGQTNRKGGTARRIVTDPVAAEWVRKAFRWFVEDRVSIQKIAHRLICEGAPLPPHAANGLWSQAGVRRLLGNERYTGRWAYGKTRSTWNNAKSYTRQVPRDTPLKEQQFEDLRIIDDVTFRKAQEILAANRHHIAGRRPRDTSTPRPKLLNGLLYCCEHDRPLIVGAHHGRHMYCPVCRKDPKPALYSMLPRELATRQICETIADLIRQDEKMIQQVIEACQRHIELAGKPDPARLEALKRKEATLTTRIGFIMDAPGETDADRAESKRRLQALRADRTAVQTQIAEMEAASHSAIAIPTAEDVRRLMDDLAGVLLEATGSDDPAVWGAARRILEDVTGGRIVVTQQGEAKARQGWLRGTFRGHVVRLLARSTGYDCPDEGVEVTVDFREPSPETLIADQVKDLYDQGMLYKDIARQLKVRRLLVARALTYWFESRGLPVPDGRLRRFELEQQAPNAHKFQQIADEALRLYDQGLLLEDIAREIDCHYSTVTKAVRHALELRDRPFLDGRTRLRGVARRSRRGDRMVPATTPDELQPELAVEPDGDGRAEGVAGESAADARPVA